MRQYLSVPRNAIIQVIRLFKFLRHVLAALLGCMILYAGLFWLLRNPVLFGNTGDNIFRASPERLRADVEFLAAIKPGRAFENPAGLNVAIKHIESEFSKAGCGLGRLRRESFEVNGNAYHNIVCSLGPLDKPRIVIGAHYDVAGLNNPGADDNASGVAGLLEIARLLEGQTDQQNQRVDLVAFTLEEPPNFKTPNMGSFYHARNLAIEKADVRLMISLEMIGYFSDEPYSQKYPLGLLNLFYPSRGNFIGIIGHWSDRSTVTKVKERFWIYGIPVYSINAPAFVTGVDFSDHWSFWEHRFPAVMITDTSFLRNPNYHQPTDTPDTLDYERMAAVVTEVAGIVLYYGKPTGHWN